MVTVAKSLVEALVKASAKRSWALGLKAVRSCVPKFSCAMCGVRV